MILSHAPTPCLVPVVAVDVATASFPSNGTRLTLAATAQGRSVLLWASSFAAAEETPTPGTTGASVTARAQASPHNNTAHATVTLPAGVSASGVWLFPDSASGQPDARSQQHNRSQTNQCGWWLIVACTGASAFVYFLEATTTTTTTPHGTLTPTEWSLRETLIGTISLPGDRVIAATVVHETPREAAAENGGVTTHRTSTADNSRLVLLTSSNAMATYNVSAPPSRAVACLSDAAQQAGVNPAPTTAVALHAVSYLRPQGPSLGTLYCGALAGPTAGSRSLGDAATWALAGTVMGEVCLVEAATGAVASRASAHPRGVVMCAAMRDGFVVSGSDDRTVVLTQIVQRSPKPTSSGAAAASEAPQQQEQELRVVARSAYFESRVRCCDVFVCGPTSGDPQTVFVAVGTEDGAVRLLRWQHGPGDLGQHRPLDVLTVVSHLRAVHAGGHGSGIIACRLFLSSNRLALLTGGADTTARLTCFDDVAPLDVGPAPPLNPCGVTGQTGVYSCIHVAAPTRIRCVAVAPLQTGPRDAVIVAVDSEGAIRVELVLSASPAVGPFSPFASPQTCGKSATLSSIVGAVPLGSPSATAVNVCVVGKTMAITIGLGGTGKVFVVLATMRRSSTDDPWLETSYELGALLHNHGAPGSVTLISTIARDALCVASASSCGTVRVSSVSLRGAPNIHEITAHGTWTLPKPVAALTLVTSHQSTNDRATATGPLGIAILQGGIPCLLLEEGALALGPISMVPRPVAVSVDRTFDAAGLQITCWGADGTRSLATAGLAPPPGADGESTTTTAAWRIQHTTPAVPAVIGTPLFADATHAVTLGANGAAALADLRYATGEVASGFPAPVAAGRCIAATCLYPRPVIARSATAAEAAAEPRHQPPSALIVFSTDGTRAQLMRCAAATGASDYGGSNNSQMSRFSPQAVAAADVNAACIVRFLSSNDKTNDDATPRGAVLLGCEDGALCLLERRGDNGPWQRAATAVAHSASVFGVCQVAGATSSSSSATLAVSVGAVETVALWEVEPSSTTRSAPARLTLLHKHSSANTAQGEEDAAQRYLCCCSAPTAVSAGTAAGAAGGGQLAVAAVGTSGGEVRICGIVCNPPQAGGETVANSNAKTGRKQQPASSHALVVLATHRVDFGDDFAPAPVLSVTSAGASKSRNTPSTAPLVFFSGHSNGAVAAILVGPATTAGSAPQPVQQRVVVQPNRRGGVNVMQFVADSAPTMRRDESETPPATTNDVFNGTLIFGTDGGYVSVCRVAFSADVGNGMISHGSLFTAQAAATAIRVILPLLSSGRQVRFAVVEEGRRLTVWQAFTADGAEDAHCAPLYAARHAVTRVRAAVFTCDSECSDVLVAGQGLEAVALRN